MYGYIYLRTNKINGKMYVGQHKYICETPQIDNKYKGSGKLFKIAIEKWGEENFTYELIDSADTPEELNSKEIYWIDKLETIAPKGYNISLGGTIHFDNETTKNNARNAALARGKGWHQPLSQRLKMQEFMRNREITDEFRKNCALSKYGNHNGSGNKDSFWITDGINNYKLPKGSAYDTTKFRLGRTISEKTKVSIKEKYANKVYVHKGSDVRCINKDELDTFLSCGYVLGKDKTVYKKIGESISNGKKGTIRIDGPNGEIKYIKESELNSYVLLGYRKHLK